MQFKFERIFGFCVNCRCLGHMTNTCCVVGCVRVEPDCFSPRMFTRSTNYRRFFDPDFSSYRSGRVVSTTLGAPLAHPGLSHCFHNTNSLNH